jgi:hypothetical protein
MVKKCVIVPAVSLSPILLTLALPATIVLGTGFVAVLGGARRRSRRRRLGRGSAGRRILAPGPPHPRWDQVLSQAPGERMAAAQRGED